MYLLQREVVLHTSEEAAVQCVTNAVRVSDGESEVCDLLQRAESHLLPHQL